ncbi:MAG: helix-turn-helix domain-containing protein [Actinomycetota bacterium]
MTSRPAAAQHLSDLARLRRVRDRIDREYARPLDVEALARGVYMSAGHLSRQFRRAYGESPYAYLMTRRIERAMTLLRPGTARWAGRRLDELGQVQLVDPEARTLQQHADLPVPGGNEGGVSQLRPERRWM